MARSDLTPDYVDFGDHVRNAGLGQCQYVSRYVGGRHGYPDFGEGLRFQGDPIDYHFLEIHKDDVDTFIERVKEHLHRRGF
jgi:hypothetical protein